jgi:hypothetical protein
MKKLHFYYTFFFLLNICSAFAQLNSSEKEYYKIFDSIVGVSNTGIFDGIEYREKYVTINGNHKYFQTSEYLIGNIIYNEQPYYDIEMKYDLYNDELIVKLRNNIGFFVIKLIKEKIDNFTINNHSFVKITSNDKKFNSEIFEILFKSNDLILYKKHKKFRKEHLDKKFAYSEFSYKKEYLLYFNESYYSIKTKKNLIQLFPEHKRQINSLIRSNKRLLYSNLDTNVIQLMKIINNDLIKKMYK